MSVHLIESVFRSLRTPVIVCRNAADYPVVFLNPEAQLLLNPYLAASRVDACGKGFGSLGALVRLQPEKALCDIADTAVTSGSVSDYSAALYDFEGQLTPVSVTANFIVLEDDEYLAFYLHVKKDGNTLIGELSAGLMSHVLQTAYGSPSMDRAINKILRITGECARVSRAYIFEEVSAGETSNTYEWCGQGVDPAIQDLQNLCKSDYNYDAIVGGAYVANDIRELPESDFRILDAQGIKSLAILPMYYNEIPFGYVGFDDCQAHRRWSALEIDLLKSISSVLASLIVRRNAEEKAARSLEILQTVSDNMDNIVYVNDVQTYELVFVNKALAHTLGLPAEEMLGKSCWQVLQKGMEGPCDFCPMSKMMDESGNIIQQNYVWETQNSLDHNWYLVNDSIISWVDGRKVHLETGNEITNQKRYEQQLQYFASTDTMTGAYNREWGHKLMREMLLAPQYGRGARSLVFIDLDGLKLANDTYGHDAGDDMLISVVSAIRCATRKSDLLFRWGGDEFILLLECGIENAERIINSVQRGLELQNNSGEKPYRLGFSYGITDFLCGSGIALDEIVMDADKKMYANKMQKRK